MGFVTKVLTIARLVSAYLTCLVLRKFACYLIEFHSCVELGKSFLLLCVLFTEDVANVDALTTLGFAATGFVAAGVVLRLGSFLGRHVAGTHNGEGIEGLATANAVSW